MSTLSASGIGPRGEPRGQRLALEQLHRDEELAVRLADLVQLADVGVRHAGRRPRLAPEALSRLRIAAGPAHHLDGDLAVEALVGGGVDDAHPSFAELRHDAVVGNRVGHVRRGFYTAMAVVQCRLLSG